LNPSKFESLDLGPYSRSKDLEPGITTHEAEQAGIWYPHTWTSTNIP